MHIFVFVHNTVEIDVLQHSRDSFITSYCLSTCVVNLKCSSQLGTRLPGTRLVEKPIKVTRLLRARTVMTVSLQVTSDGYPCPSQTAASGMFCSILNNKMFYSFLMLSNIFPVCYVTDQKRLRNVFYITYAV